MVPLLYIAALAALSGEPRPLPSVVADLGSRDFAVREAASAELLKSEGTYKLAELEKALSDAALSPEQRLRLDEAAFRAFADSPRAAIGVQFSQQNVAAEVESVRDGFPAKDVLKAHDVITQVDGENVSSGVSWDGKWSTVRALVVSHDPGDKVPVVVQRNGAPVQLTLQLGEFQRLGQTIAVTSTELRAAWQHRLRRTAAGAGGGGANVASMLDATTLRPRGVPNDFDGRPIDVVEQVTTMRAMSGESPSVVAGASPDGTRQVERFDMAVGSGLQRFNNNNGWVLGARNGAMLQMDPRGLARMSDAELVAERLRLFQMAQTYMMIADQQRQNGSRGGQSKVFTDMYNQTIQQHEAIVSEINKRKRAKQDANPPQPAPAVAPDDQKPDQKAEKP
ncbi:MAG: PDZ domain-containing protein [Phycisphaerales bacterium]